MARARRRDGRRALGRRAGPHLRRVLRAHDDRRHPARLSSTWDLLVHGWDVARATGQAYDISDADAVAHDATADGWGDALYAEGICGAAVAVPDGASPGERLLGRLGRDPGWTAA
ncbi:hypothetical protein QE364_001557 [Nocardioides zeae]|uniref:Uncharacterized protein n=1 Tax=Nocardioides zeae TaxID=1457234 RepID=A0ACC6IH72_9ACTN|nr:hypothetical protein [Nocardioides zeae]MDR6172847.1 hypothetical protein [Nocardioides zeae]MDR6209857.1 hypothetical protein [Nocardioides zeae]